MLLSNVYGVQSLLFLSGFDKNGLTVNIFVL